MNLLRISRIFDQYSLDLIDRKLYRHEGGKTIATHLGSIEELKRAPIPRSPRYLGKGSVIPVIRQEYPATLIKQ